MIVAIHQPAYLPWLGYFDRIRQADLFIYLDTVQFQKGSFQNRNKVLTRNGPIWLTVPVITSGKLFTTALKDLETDARQSWQAKHLATLQQAYRSAPWYAERSPRIEAFYREPMPRLSDLCWQMLQVFVQELGITTRLVKASELPPVEGHKSDLVLGLCRATGATQYLSGSLGRHYLDESSFADAGIAVRYQDYVPRPYRQLADPFVPGMGVVDVLYNEADPAAAL